MSSAFNILKNAAEKLDTGNVKPNEIDSFFSYVATKVKKYSSETQTSVQHAVFEILMKADRGYYDWAAPNYQHTNWQNIPENLPPAAQSQQYPGYCTPQQHLEQPLDTVSTAIQSPSNSLTNISSQPSPSESSYSDLV